MDEKPKVYKVVISPAANDRMYEHFYFLAQLNERAALRLLETLVKDMASLKEMPEKNPRYEREPAARGKYRYKLSAKRYRIVFTIEGNSVLIDDIQDCRQDENKSGLR